MIDRMNWAYRRRERYLEWASEVLASPYDMQDKLEFAIITAHVPFEASVRGFQATRGVEGLQELADALSYAGVLGAGNKAAHIQKLRDMLPCPTMSYREWRASNKLPGLGYCKLSFACCLIDPIGADVVCIDTHIAQIYGADAPKLWRTPAEYERVESLLAVEAESVGLPPFPYQWAIWDWKRLRGGPGVTGARVNSHSFLWRQPEYLQLPLFPSG